MANFFGGFARRSQIDAVTSNKDEPAPVYALQELAETVRNADGKTIDQIASYLSETRLGNKSCTVKLKALKAIKYVANKPECSSFRSAMQQHSGNLRECVTFSCPPDSMKGNKPAEQVRQAAKDAIHSIFSTESGGEGSRQSLQGFGSTSEKASTTAASMFSKKPEGGRGGGGGGGITLTWGKSNGFNQSPQFAGSLENSPRAFPPANVESHQFAPVPINYRNEPSSSEASIDRMEQLLEKICSRKGMKLQPPPDEVMKYVSAAQDVHIEDLWLTLKCKLAEGPWRHQYIGLCLLQALIGCHNKAFGKAIRDHVSSDAECVERLGNTQHATLSHKAKSILSKLGGGAQQDLAAQPAHVPQMMQAQPQAPQGDLLDLGLDAAVPSQPQGGSNFLQELEAGGNQSAPQPVVNAAAPASSDLFAGLSVSSASQQQEQGQVLTALNSSAAPAPAPGPAPGLFDGLEVNQKGSNSAGVPPPSAAEAQSLDLLNNGSTGATNDISALSNNQPPQAAPPMNSMNAGGPQMMMPPPMMPPAMMPPMMQMQGMGNMNPMQVHMMQQQQMMMMQQQMMMQQPRFPMGMGMPPPAAANAQGRGPLDLGLSSPQATHARNSTMIDGRARPEPAFNFVQDHIQTLKGGGGAMKK